MSYQKHKSEESIEDYLETILILNRQLANVRSIDIANELNYSKPSVSVAMKNLRQKGYITVSEEGFIRLTDACRMEHDLSAESFDAIKGYLLRNPF